MGPPRSIRVGTRSSRLALLQAEGFLRALREACPGVEAEVVGVETRADRFVHRRIHELGTGVFVKEIDDRVLSGELDAAVHSLKDVPTELPEGLAITAVLPRGPRHDLLISTAEGGLGGLPRSATVGTSSVRRRAQLLRARPDLRPVEMRGNIETRLRKVANGECGAAVLSAAAIERLGLLPPGGPARATGVGREGLVVSPLDPDRFVPAPGQGAIAIAARAGSPWTEPLARVDDPTARAETDLERGVLRELGAGCIAPVAVSAVSRDGRLEVRAEVLAPDGSRSATFRGEAEPGPQGIRRVAEALRRQGAEELIHGARA